MQISFNLKNLSKYSSMKLQAIIFFLIIVSTVDLAEANIIPIKYIDNVIPDFGEVIRNTWMSGNENGTFTNAIFYDEFSDPNLIRIDDYYLTRTSNSPGTKSDKKDGSCFLLKNEGG
jgi:hypothetical protein